MFPIESRLSESLKSRKEAGNLRRLKTERAVVDFFSNDYLGVARNEELQKRVAARYEATKNKISGATGSRLLSGNTPYYESLEKELADLFNAESSLIFNSGYTANLAIFSSIPQKGDTIIYDELIHACIKEGSRLSFAERFSFRHNDVLDLEQKLKKAKGEKFVAIESIYSMDGDFAPINDIVSVCKRFGAYLIIDEAHGTGVFGENGNGLACELGLQKDVFVRTYTFGKAIGSHGACVAASKVVREYLVNFARSFIYTTALPLHNLISVEEAFKLIAEKPELQQALRERIEFFRKLMKEDSGGIQYIDSSSSIQAVLVSGNEDAKSLSGKLIDQGFDVRPILSPTVREGKERVRICLHVYNTYKEIEGLVKSINEFRK
jgi:8-amino-7-oxononanoate synthase